MAQRDAMFLRTATGLVRPWSSFDGFIYNLIAINPAIVLGFGFVNGLGIAPGGNMWLAIAAMGVFCTALAYVEASMISSMPRSGGDYVFQSRILGGGIGYINLFVFIVIMQTIWFAYPAWWAAVFSLAPFFVVFGAMWKIQALTNAALWVQTGDGFMVLGTIIIAWGVIINLAGMVWYRRVQKAFFYVGMVGMVIMIAMLLTTSQAAFEQGFNNFWVNVFGMQPAQYQAVAQIAEANGYSGFLSQHSNSGWETLIIGMPLALTFMFPAWSAFNAGEIKGASGFRAQMFQVVLAEIVSVVIALALYTGIASMVGDAWYKQISWLYWNNPASYPFPVGPYFGFLSAMIFTNPIPMLVVFVTLQAWFWMWYPNIGIGVSRTMLAMAFDRELPSKLADVDPRTRAPWVAILVCGAAAMVFVALFAYANFSQYVLAASLVSILGFAGTALAAVVMPWRRRELYKSSPISRYELGGIPTLTIAGLIWLIFSVITVFIFLTEPRVFLSTTNAWIYLIGMYVLAALLYFAFRIYNRRRNIRVDLLYREIPVE